MKQAGVLAGINLRRALVAQQTRRPVRQSQPIDIGQRLIDRSRQAVTGQRTAAPEVYEKALALAPGLQGGDPRTLDARDE